MPQRQNTRRVSSEAVQGEDSYIVIRSPTVREARSIADQWDKWDDGERVDALKAIIAGWNWVDDAGQPLTQVQDNPQIILDLTGNEIQFIIDAMAGGASKN